MRLKHFACAVLSLLVLVQPVCCRQVKQAADSDSPFLNFDAESELDSLNKQIESLVKAGNYQQSKSLSEKAVTVARKEFGENHLQFAKALNNLAWHQQTLGDYRNARENFERVLKIEESQYGKNAPQLATVLNNLALLLSAEGDLETALPLLKRVLELQVLVLGTSHAELIYTLNNLAAVQSALGDDEGSKVSLEMALSLKDVKDIQAKTQVLNNLAALVQKSGDLDAASKYLSEAVELGGTKDVEMVEIYNNLALIKFSQGHRPESIELLKKSLDLSKSTVGENSIDYATTLLNLALLTYRSGDRAAAEQQFLRAAELVDAHIKNVLPGLSFAEQRAFLSRKLPLIQSDLISIAAENPATARGTYSHLFRWKGLLIESLRNQIEIRNTNNPQARELERTRRELAAAYHDVGDVDYEKWKSRFAELTARKEQIERELTAHGGNEFQDILANVDLAGFAKLLQPKEELVDIYLYKDMQSGKQKYAAFGVTADGAVTFTDLGLADQIDKSVVAWRKAVIERSAIAVQSDIDAKLTGMTSGMSSLFICPDGELFRFPINMSAFNDKQRVALLDTPRELAYIRAQPTTSTTGGNKMLVVGGVDFGAGIGPVHVPALPGTLREANALIALARSNSFDTTLLTGSEATKEAVLSELQHSDYAHLATHGIFSGAGMALQEMKAAAGDATISGASRDVTRNPLLSSALILAAPTTGPEAGRAQMLTAEEMLNSDLSRAKFIVLSACETGLGTKEVGQGVLGLRASMMAAGAKTLVMSLWKVPDLPTSLLIKKFYENMLVDKQAPADALRNAQTFVAQYDGGLFKAPVNWAAWVLVGQGWN